MSDKFESQKGRNYDMVIQALSELILSGRRNFEITLGIIQELERWRDEDARAGGQSGEDSAG